MPPLNDAASGTAATSTAPSETLRAVLLAGFWTGYEDSVRVPYGALIDEPSLKPTAHMFVGSKAPWHEILDDLPRHDEAPWR